MYKLGVGQLKIRILDSRRVYDQALQDRDELMRSDHSWDDEIFCRKYNRLTHIISREGRNIAFFEFKLRELDDNSDSGCVSQK